MRQSRGPNQFERSSTHIIQRFSQLARANPFAKELAPSLGGSGFRFDIVGRAGRKRARIGLRRRIRWLVRYKRDCGFCGHFVCFRRCMGVEMYRVKILI